MQTDRKEIESLVEQYNRMAQYGTRDAPIADADAICNVEFPWSEIPFAGMSLPAPIPLPSLTMSKAVHAGQSAWLLCL